NGTPERVYRRVARLGDEAFVNLGGGRVVRMAGGRWALLRTVPPGVYFRRSVAMAQQVDPAPPGAGDLAPLRRFANVSDEDWPVLLAWMVHALIDSDSPHVALLLDGDKGAGKSTLTRVLSSLVDPTGS